MNNLVFEMTGPATAICTQDSCEATGPATAICTQDGCEATAICTQDSCGADAASFIQQHGKVALGHNQIAPPQYQYTQQSFQSAPAFLC